MSLNRTQGFFDPNDIGRQTQELERNIQEQSTLGSIQYFDAADTAGGVSITGTPTNIQFTDVTTSDPVFSSTEPGVVKVSQESKYEIYANASIYITSGTTRTESQVWLERDQAFDAWSEVPGTRRIIYNRTSPEGGGSVAINRMIELKKDESIRIMGELISGSSTLETFPDGSSLMMKVVQ